MLKSVDLYIDAYIGKDQGESLFGGEKSFGLSNLNEFLSGIEKDVTDINVHINSGGGSVDEGFAIYDKLNNSPYSITTIAEGTVGSIATIIYLAGQTRKMFENSKFFIHNPYAPIYGENLESKDAQKLADELKSEEERILNFYVEKTGKKAEEIKPFMDAQTSFTSTEAVEMGFATDIVKKEVKNKKEYKLVAFKENLNSKNDTMKKEEQVSWFKKIESKLNKIIKNEEEVKAAMTKTSEGVEVWFSGPLEVGTKVCLDEAMTQPAPDGVHTIGDVKATIKAGEVESMEEVVNETEALKTENEKLKSELQAAKLEATELKNKQTETEKTIGELQVEIVNFRKTVIGETPEKPVVQSFSKGKDAPGKYDNIIKNAQSKYAKK